MMQERAIFQVGRKFHNYMTGDKIGLEPSLAADYANKGLGAIVGSQQYDPEAEAAERAARLRDTSSPPAERTGRKA